MSSVIAFVHVHPYFLAYAILNIVVGLTPKRLQAKSVFGLVLAVMHQWAFLAHSDQPGTLQIPLIAKEIVLWTEGEIEVEIARPTVAPPPVPASDAGAAPMPKVSDSDVTPIIPPAGAP
jgi:hypothetical protein